MSLCRHGIRTPGECLDCVQDGAPTAPYPACPDTDGCPMPGECETEGRCAELSSNRVGRRRAAELVAGARAALAEGRHG